MASSETPTSAGRGATSKRGTTAKRGAAATREQTVTRGAGELTCPECGRTFPRAASLGAHRRQAHGVQGSSPRARSSARRRSAPAGSAATAQGRTQASRAGTVDSEALLRTLFPDGIPANAETIRALGRWLDEAQRLASSA